MFWGVNHISVLCLILLTLIEVSRLERFINMALYIHLTKITQLLVKRQTFFKHNFCMGSTKNLLTDCWKMRRCIRGAMESQSN